MRTTFQFRCIFCILQDEIVKVRDASTQMESIGVPEEHLSGHAFHTYRYSLQCLICGMYSKRQSHRQCVVCWSAFFLADNTFDHDYLARACCSTAMHAACADCLCNTCAQKGLERWILTPSMTMQAHVSR